jgi:hypothetical protein
MVSQELYYDFIDVRIGFFFRLKTKQKHGRKEMANEVIAKYGKKEGWALRYYYVKYAARNDKLTGGIELKKVKEPYVVKNGAPEIIISRPNPLVVSQVPLQDLPDIAVWMNFPEERHGEIDIKCAEEFYVKSERKSTKLIKRYLEDQSIQHLMRTSVSFLGSENEDTIFRVQDIRKKYEIYNNLEYMVHDYQEEIDRELKKILPNYVASNRHLIDEKKYIGLVHLLWNFHLFSTSLMEIISG